MGLNDDLRQLSEQVRKRQPHIKGEEATKQALILPFFQVLGFDIYDPTEVQPEYIADFAKKRSNGQMEKVDYAIRVGGTPAMFVECKAHDVVPEDHDGQLARYFNSTPSVRVSVVTNGLKYRFFTDLRAPNVMDAAPFFEFNILSFSDRDAENLRTFTKDGFNPSAVQTCAEEIIYADRLSLLVNEILRNPSENFVRFLLGELDLVSGRVTAKVVERFTPIVRRSVQTTILDMMTRSLQQEISSPATPAPASIAPASTPSAPEPQPESRSAQVVTTADELELFDIVSKVCAESSSKQSIAHKDTASYFGINLGGKVSQWFIRAFFNGPKKSLVTRVALDQAQLLARGFEVEAAPDGVGVSRVYVQSAKDAEKLRALVLVAFEDQVRRAASDGESGSA